jgi:hypothetical protein
MFGFSITSILLLYKYLPLDEDRAENAEQVKK